MARTCSFCLVQLVLVSSEPLPLRDIDAFLDPVFVPDFFFDLAEGTEVFDALSSVAPDGQSYRASVLDLMVPEAPRMAPVLLWQTRLWRALSGADISQVIIDVGAHEWSRFLPELRADPRAWLVLVEPGRAAFLELYRRLKVDYADVLSRVVALPVALSWEPGLTWGFRSLHTNDFLGGECNSLLAPNESFDHACTAKGPVIIVPVTSLDLLLHGLMLGTKPSEAKPDFSEALQQGPPIKLKLDAQGADVEILSALAYSSSPLASAFLERIEEVQLEVSVPLYHGQPSRHQTLTRMLELGYQLDWRREEIQDGGTHKVVMGCRLVAENPRTEDCFFVRSSSWPHGRVLDLVMRRPVEILRLNEGSELSISSQYSYYMKRHVDECEQDEEMMMLTKQMGTGLACLFGAVGWPLRFVIHAVIELWELIWSVKRDLDQDAVLSHYVRVFKAMWGILMLDGHSWEELHDAGVAHMVFTVLVEATCLAFPAACSTECQNSDAHEMALLAGRPSPCVTLADCAHLMIDHFDDVVENPGSYVRIFRAAERLSAPRCFQLKMELDRSRSPMFPSTVTSGGEYNVTALDADTTHCALEISLVAWSVDADGMLLFHRHIWEMTDHIKAMDSTDFRMPTEGALWEFECVFEGQRSRGDVFSASMLAEMPGTKDPPVLFVRCEAPERWADDLVSGGSAPDFPHEVVLRRSARAPLQMPNLELVVPLRQSLRQAEPRPHIALCTQQVWDFEGLEQRVPKHAEFWFRYYSDYLGVDKIYLYDLDGSFRELSIVKELQERGKLFYEGSIPSIPPLRDLYQKAGYKTSTTHLAQTLVQQHCWQRARQNADWVISVSHGWDMFLFSPSMGTLADLLQELDPRELTYVLGVRYGIKQDAPKAAEANVFTRFPYHIDPSVRPEQLLSTEEQIVIANPRLVDTAVLGDVVIRQEAPLYSNMLAPLETCSSTPEFAGPLMQKRVLDPLKWRANHYVSLLGRAVVFRVEDQCPEYITQAFVTLKCFWHQLDRKGFRFMLSSRLLVQGSNASAPGLFYL